jgi:flagellar L-ring protein FlgH
MMMIPRTLTLLVALPLAACISGDPGARPDPALAPPLPTPLASAPAAANGAIFQANAGYAPLTHGNRAARVGDMITISLVERTSASKQNSADTGRDGSFGLTPPVTGPLALFDPADLKMGGSQSFKGNGTAAQSNQLSGEITVTVAEVYANGTMRVAGEKRVTINRGDEYIRLTGLVRAADIGADNRIASTRVADARISYAGSGEIARASKQGWLQRFFAAVSPF